jgi:aspartate/methionine/tyrosine aminotransferase
LLGAGSRVLICTPAYQSIPEMARDAGAAVEAYAYSEKEDFRPDAGELAARIAGAQPPFACVFLNSPHNPTGRTLDTAALERILDAAGSVGTRVIVDEVMTGIFAENTERVPSAALLSREAIVIGNVSKSLGLGGLRTGWIVAPVDVIDRCTQWRYYTTISPPAIVQQLARIAVEQRARILAENEQVVRANHRSLSSWCARHESALRLLPWEGGTVVLARLLTGETDEEFSRRMATDAHVFVVPCAAFDLPGYLRIGLGMAPLDFNRALARIEPLLFESKMRR